MANGFDALTDAIKQNLKKAQDFVNLTVDQLKTIPQDVLASLQVNRDFKMYDAQARPHGLSSKR